MQIKVTYIDKTLATITIIADEPSLGKIKQQVIGDLAKTFKLPGFRSGKVPSQLVEKNIDAKMFESKFLEDAIQELYFQAIQSENLRPIENPKISLTKFVPYSNLELQAEVSVIGKVTLPHYENLSIKKGDPTVSKQAVNQVLNSLQQRSATKKPVERASKEGDEVVLDFSANDKKGNPIPGATGSDYPLVLGSNTFIPGFEANIIGLKALDSKDFNITFPKEYQVKTLANKEVTFSVTIKMVNEMILPELDDEFAKKAGPFDDLKSLKADISKQLLLEKEKENEVAFESDIITSISKQSDVAIPKALIDEEINRMEQEEKQNILYRGQTWDEHLKEENLTSEEHFEQKRSAAEDRVKASLVLSEIAEKNNISVTNEELQHRIQTLKSQYKDERMQQELDDPNNRQSLISQIVTEKTFSYLKSRIKITNN
ncbi:MAG: trigger factor [Candidatus Saccharimonadales bacterium]